MTATCTTYYQHTDMNATSGALTHRYYVRDYLGSTRAVIDEEGNVLQSTAYYPSGVPLTPNSLTPQTIKLHTGKDFFDLQGAGWYDNQARYYDCLIPTFKSIDPLAEKYPWLSPYNHCANNPLRFVDRNGKDFYNIDFDTGVVSFIEKTNDKTDRLFSMNKGIIDYNNYIDLTKGIIGNAQTDNISIRTDAGDVFETKISIYSSTTDNTELFKFVSLNSDVEWSQVKTLDNTTGIHKFYLGTSHNQNLDGSMSYISQINVISPFMITEANHCHPNGSLVVSSGDISVAKEISLKNPNATFSIYSSIDFTNKIFTPNTEPDMLPEIIVTP